ncbi:kinase-like domain-containing protein [Ochromonadaceae sp. CCMP2298]|nr:kinase-like domain-containing protein [Ochromonadaceae sp. CCMP2298]
MSIWRSLLFVLALSGASSEECKVLAKPRDGNPKNYDSVEIFWSNENDFRVTKRLGSGSFGEAYLGHNMSAPEQDREQFVIKVYRFGKIKVKKMVREIMVTQRVCGHPNIVRLHHVIHQSLTDEETTVAGTLYYKSPEMLLESHHTDLSTDMWSVGSLLAAWLFRKPIYFKGEEDELNQLRKIANVLGTPALLDMVHKYKLKFNDSMIAEPIPKVSWESLVTESTAAFATADALDLLDRMLV